jgi:uncharacterized protein (TIGR02444 family)
MPQPPAAEMMSDTQAQPATALWRFSLAVYARAGVAPECLDVQERFGADVNLLLFSAYLGAIERVVLSKDDLGQAAAVVDGWHRDVVRTLRRTRRTLKPLSEAGAGPLANETASLRARVKAAELEAERIEQAMLWTSWRARAMPPQRAAAQDALAANVRAVLLASGARERDADQGCTLPYLLQAALAERAQMEQMQQ